MSDDIDNLRAQQRAAAEWNLFCWDNDDLVPYHDQAAAFDAACIAGTALVKAEQGEQ